MKADLAIVIPVYNEADNIKTTLVGINRCVKKPFTVYIVYDLDSDTTIPVAQSAADELGMPVQFLKNRFGRGALNAIKTGLNFTDEKFVVVTMADLSDPPEVINSLFSQAQITNSDIVCASRYMRGGKQIGGPWLKGFLSRMAGVSLYYFAGVPTQDATNSFKLYSRRVIQALPIESRGGFELGIELVVKAHLNGFKVTEVPTVWRDRTNGTSRFQLWKWLPLYLKWYFLAYRNWVPRCWQKNYSEINSVHKD